MYFFFVYRIKMTTRDINNKARAKRVQIQQTGNATTIEVHHNQATQNNAVKICHTSEDVKPTGRLHNVTRPEETYLATTGTGKLIVEANDIGFYSKETDGTIVVPTTDGGDKIVSLQDYIGEAQYTRTEIGLLRLMNDLREDINTEGGSITNLLNYVITKRENLVEDHFALNDLDSSKNHRCFEMFRLRKPSKPL